MRDPLLTNAVHDAARPLAGDADDYDALLELVGDARFVLLGEATHGTHEFYRERAQITRRLIEEKGFSALALEADWPDAYRVTRYVRGDSSDADAAEALADFQRFPTWMWRNADVLDFVGWLREHNDALPSSAARVGFYGLDLYSLHASMEAVIRYLNRIDPQAAKRARYRYSCFDQFGEDVQNYGWATRFDLSDSCEKEAVAQLIEMQRRAAEYARRDGRFPKDEFFFAEQNARLVKNAEQYYRSMFGSRVSSWNVRDRHMAETLEELAAHFESQHRPSKIVVWAHNSHIGDARATEMGQSGELNIGQLTRQRFAGETVLVGFTTYHGTVTAASDWDEPPQRQRVRPALPGSYEALFHATGLPSFFLSLREMDTAKAVRRERLERAIGVVYRPETERVSHYFNARLAQQFDAVIHWDNTRAVEPLERIAGWDTGDVPETFPTGV